MVKASAWSSGYLAVLTWMVALYAFAISGFSAMDMDAPADEYGWSWWRIACLTYVVCLPLAALVAAIALLMNAPRTFPAYFGGLASGAVSLFAWPMWARVGGFESLAATLGFLVLLIAGPPAGVIWWTRRAQLTGSNEQQTPA